MADSGTFTASTVKTSMRAPRRRVRRWPRIFLGALAVIVLLVLVLVGVGVFWLRSATIAALPQLDGDLRITNLSAPVMVRRDAHGAPHIQAATQDDLFIAQGYVAAQDRLWQMDTYRRSANGELAEVLGSRLLQHDTLQRVMGYRRVAQRVYANLAADDRRRLDDYARGVNLFIEQHQNSLPEEFRILGYKPRPWGGADSMSIAMMMVDMLDSHWGAKLGREEIAAKLNNPRLEAELYPVGSWRDRPPTGEVIDLTQPQPAAPTSDDDDEDERTQTRQNAPAIAFVQPLQPRRNPRGPRIFGPRFLPRFEQLGRLRKAHCQR